jgi:uncharacterized membrane protein
MAANQYLMTRNNFFLKKYFVGLKIGCIFASAFDEKRVVEKLVDNESERNLKQMRR